jgi:prevent-host-death family protein
MAKTVTLRDANQNFAKYIREVEAGEEIAVTRRGEVVAKIVPAKPALRVLTPEQEEALRGLERFWNAGHRSDRQWTRDELHDR